MAGVAVQVFGAPITQGTRTQRAQVAAKFKNADGKHDEVLKHVSLNSQKVAAGRKPSVQITNGLIYNATGDPITYVIGHDWEGHIAGRLQVVIQNGQYASFYHCGEPHHEGSVGAVVFNIQGFTDSMIAWSNPKKRFGVGKNTAYCQMEDPGYFNYYNCDWNELLHNVRDCGSEYEASMEGFTTKVHIDAQGNFRAEFLYDAA